MFKLNQRSWFPPPFCDVRALKPRMNREQVLPGHLLERVYSDDSGHERTGENPCMCGLTVEHSGAPLAARPSRWRVGPRDARQSYSAHERYFVTSTGITPVLTQDRIAITVSGSTPINPWAVNASQT